MAGSTGFDPATSGLSGAGARPAPSFLAHFRITSRSAWSFLRWPLASQTHSADRRALEITSFPGSFSAR